MLPRVRADDVAEWRLSGLEPGVGYEYQILGPAADGATSALYAGKAVTQRPPGEHFTFALISDSHIGADLAYTNQGDETVLSEVANELAAAAPDFVINLGDILDFHEYGFNTPPPSGTVTRSAYLNYRESFGAALGELGHFGVIGNWDGENGSFTAEELQRSRQQRLLYLPNPGPDTFPEGGSAAQDYYAFTWGDALFVVLNVMSYTTTAHLLSSTGGQPDDWTLGGAQLTWLRRTLENATVKWRFLFIHHAVGGAAGDAANSAYGRGGGQAAQIGEQAEVHALMQEEGVQVFFYGHDHVFTDMVVDGIHYSALGSAGAPWKFSSAQTGYAQYWEQSGWSRVDVTPENVHVQFIGLGGEPLLDYGLPP
jgi:predicted phosphodiesterase